jgi:hypothetical protein
MDHHTGVLGTTPDEAWAACASPLPAMELPPRPFLQLHPWTELPDRASHRGCGLANLTAGLGCGTGQLAHPQAEKSPSQLIPLPK